MASIEERVKELETHMATVKSALFDNGHEGLITRFNRFETKWTTREEDKKVYDDRQALKTNVIIAIGMLILTGLLAFFTWLGVNKDKQSLLRSEHSIQTVAEDATAR